VCTIEFCKIVTELYFEFSPPAMIYQTNGEVTPWLRYAEWLLTCPVILIHLSNITGLNDDYSGRTMSLITSDLGGICMAVTSALSKGWLKWLFFVIGCCYGASTFYHAALIYIESYYTMPHGVCKNMVLAMAAVFFTSWFMFPGLFLAGPEGTNALSWAGSTIGHTVADLLSKNAWGMIGHFLRLEIHKHIIIHGDVRRPITVNTLGREVTVSCFVDKEEEDEDERISTKTYANRASFMKMRNNMEQRGIQTRKSLEMLAPPPALNDGSIVLAVADPMTLTFFTQQLSQLDATIRATPAMGQGQLEQVLEKGGFDGVLVSPEYIQQVGLVQRLKDKYHMPVYAFGWGKSSPWRSVIEGSGVDGWLEGPYFGSTFDTDALSDAIAEMQRIKTSYSMVMNGVGMNGAGMNGVGMNGMGMDGVGMNGAGMNGVGMNGMAGYGSVGNNMYSMPMMSQQAVMMPQSAPQMMGGMSQTQQPAMMGGMQGASPHCSVGNLQNMEGQQAVGSPQVLASSWQQSALHGGMGQQQQYGQVQQMPMMVGMQAPASPGGVQTPPHTMAGQPQMSPQQLQQQLYFMQQLQQRQLQQQQYQGGTGQR